MSRAVRVKRPSKAVYKRLRAELAKFRPFKDLGLHRRPVALELVNPKGYGPLAAKLADGRWTVLTSDVRRYLLHDEILNYRSAGDGTVSKGLLALKALRLATAEDVDHMVAFLDQQQNDRDNTRELRDARRTAERAGYQLVRFRQTVPE